MSIQRALVIGAGSGVGHATAGARTAAGARVVAAGRERDATDPAQVAALLAEADPDLVVVAAGARPRMASIATSKGTAWGYRLPGTCAPRVRVRITSACAYVASDTM